MMREMNDTPDWGPTPKYADVQTFAGRLRSNLNRSVDRSVRWKKGQRRPRRDDEIMAAWICRQAIRDGGCPVDDPQTTYAPEFESGPTAIQTASVRCLVPANEAERKLFSRVRIPAPTRTFAYFDPEWRPTTTAVF